MAFVLWQLAGCVVPPPEPGEEAVNLPPVIHWDLATPSDYKLALFDGSIPQLDFSIEGAVFDPEDDDLDYLWFVWTNNDHKIPQFGRTGMSLFPCDSAKLEKAVWVSVMVAVSDRPLTFDNLEVDSDALPVKAQPIEGETEEEAQNRIAIRSWFFDVQDPPDC